MRRKNLKPNKEICSSFDQDNFRMSINFLCSHIAIFAEENCRQTS